jgi:hypothetical protein
MGMRTEVPITEQPHGLAGWKAESWADSGAALELRAALFVRHSFLASLAFTATVIVLVIVLPAYV